MLQDLIGTIIGDRFVVERELGHGGVGAVYLARDRKLHDKRVVVKVLLDRSFHDEWVTLKFQQEREALSRVDHPGIVGILDAGELPDGKPYIVMQYIDGVTLREALEERPEGMDLTRAASILKQCGLALTAVHEKKIFHRDLKPENIMLQRLGRGEEQVKIVDFGVAKVRESALAPSTVTGGPTAGTIVYMSPEQLRGEKVTAASDIYALGIIAYEMVTGRRPFSPETVAHLAELQTGGVRVKPTDLRPRLSEEAERLILRTLSFNPSLRPESAADFGEALARALLNEDETLKLPATARVELPQTELSVGSPLPGMDTVASSTPTMIVAHEPAQPHTMDQAFVALPKPENSKKRWPLIIGGGVILTALAAGAFLIINKRQSIFGAGSKPPAVTAATEQRSLSYSLTVQKMRDGKPYKDEFQSSGQEIFENGYKFRLNVNTQQPGYLYVFNEGADKDGAVFSIIYPTPRTNGGLAKLDGAQTVQTSWNTFAGEAGTEQFWIVWSAAEVRELEQAKDAAFKDKEGAVNESDKLSALKDFLKKHSEPKPESKKDAAKQETLVQTTGALLVKLIELEHR